MNKTKPTMSKKKIATDWATYRKALIENGLDPNDYLDVKASLSAFDRIDRYYRTAQETRAVMTNHLAVADNLINEKAWPRHLNPFNCTGCKFKSYCLADLRGHDTDFLSRTEYVREGEPSFFPTTFIDEGDDA